MIKCFKTNPPDMNASIQAGKPLFRIIVFYCCESTTKASLVAINNVNDLSCVFIDISNRIAKV